MKEYLKMKIGQNGLDGLMSYLSSEKIHSLILVADQNTFRVLGKKVEKSLLDAGLEVKTVLLTDEDIYPDERTITQVLLPATEENAVYLAVGSGTISDVVRFVSHRAKMRFICLPTAPSMDGYTSSGSSLTIGGLKQTVYSRPPTAIFADLDVLTDAPAPMIASGFGDLLGKYTTLPEWRMAHLLVEEEYNTGIADRVQKSVDRTAGAIERLDEQRHDSIQILYESLIESGLCMLEHGNSRPASGAEHSLSHYWEYKLLRQKRPAVFHGTKVGVATVIIARLYRQLRKLDRQEVGNRISQAIPLTEAAEIQRIQNGYPDISAQVIELQSGFLKQIRTDLVSMQEKILQHWETILEFASQVPEPEEIERLLRKAGAPVNPSEINLTAEDVQDGLEYGFYIRSRFSLFNLLRFLGVDVKDWIES